jgi:hypothetical protein
MRSLFRGIFKFFRGIFKFFSCQGHLATGVGNLLDSFCACHFHSDVILTVHLACGQQLVDANFLEIDIVERAFLDRGTFLLELGEPDLDRLDVDGRDLFYNDDRAVETVFTPVIVDVAEVVDDPRRSMLADSCVAEATIFTAAPVLALRSKATQSGPAIFTAIFLVMDGHDDSSRWLNHAHQEFVDAISMEAQYTALAPLHLDSLEETALCRV